MPDEPLSSFPEVKIGGQALFVPPRAPHWVRLIGHGLVTKHQHVPCTTVLSRVADSPGFSTLRAGKCCCSALRAFRNQQVLGSIPSAGSMLCNKLGGRGVSGRNGSGY